MIKKALLAVTIACTSLAVAPHTSTAQWSRDWHCQLSGEGDHHRITEAAIDHWAAGTHGYWPGDCDVHVNYEPNPN